MHPELIAALAAERRRDLTASTVGDPARPSRSRHRRTLLPHYRLTWTHTSLGNAATGSAATAAAGRRERSWVIVISATRAL
jgi:hypothetical protein